MKWKSLRGSNPVRSEIPNRDPNWLPDQPLARRKVETLGHYADPMFQFQSIVVPLDGSSLAEHALPRALAIARRSGARLRLLHAFSPLETVPDTWNLHHDRGLCHRRLDQKHAYLADVARRIGNTNLAPVQIVSVVIENSLTADAIWSGTSGADLVVMATRGRGRIGRFLHGSVMDTLMRRLPCPQLFVPGYDSPVDLTSDPVVRRALLPLDGSAHRERILGPAIAISRLTGAEMTLINVQHVRGAYTSFHYCTPLGYLKSVDRAIRGRVEQVRTRVVETESCTAKAILSFADEIEADLIALTTRGRGAMSRLLRESIAYTVARTAKVPILVLHTPQAETPIRSAAVFD